MVTLGTYSISIRSHEKKKKEKKNTPLKSSLFCWKYFPLYFSTFPKALVAFPSQYIPRI